MHKLILLNWFIFSDYIEEESSSENITSSPLKTEFIDCGVGPNREGKKHGRTTAINVSHKRPGEISHIKMFNPNL